MKTLSSGRADRFLGQCKLVGCVDAAMGLSGARAVSGPEGPGRYRGPSQPAHLQGRQGWAGACTHRRWACLRVRVCVCVCECTCI